MTRTNPESDDVLVKVENLNIGDRVDLENDPYADTQSDDLSNHHYLECEYAVVATVEQETPACVRVDFESFDSVGFPTGHLVKVNKMTIPTDSNGQALAWPVPGGGFADAWNGWYPDLNSLLSEVEHWTAREADRVLAFGENLITEDDANGRRNRQS